MTGAEVTAYVIGIGTFLTGLAAFLTARSTNKKNAVEGTSIGETSLANAVKVVEEVYDKVTLRLNVQIDELLQDNQKLREEVGDIPKLRREVSRLTFSEEECRAEVTQLRAEVAELRAAS